MHQNVQDMDKVNHKQILIQSYQAPIPMAKGYTFSGRGGLQGDKGGTYEDHGGGYVVAQSKGRHI